MIKPTSWHTSHEIRLRQVKTRRMSLSILRRGERQYRCLRISRCHIPMKEDIRSAFEKLIAPLAKNNAAFSLTNTLCEQEAYMAITTTTDDDVYKYIISIVEAIHKVPKHKNGNRQSLRHRLSTPVQVLVIRSPIKERVKVKERARITSLLYLMEKEREEKKGKGKSQSTSMSSTPAPEGKGQSKGSTQVVSHQEIQRASHSLSLSLLIAVHQILHQVFQNHPLEQHQAQLQHQHLK